MGNKSSIYSINKTVPDNLYPRIMNSITTEKRRFLLIRNILNWSLLGTACLTFGFCLDRLVIQLSENNIIYFVRTLLSDIRLAPSMIIDIFLAISESLSSSILAGMSLSLILVLLIAAKFNKGSHKKIYTNAILI